MISLSTAFTIHGVVSVLFCLPVLGGMAAFIKVITNEELTSPDKFHMNVYSIDFAKNVMITLQCYAGTKMDGAAQKLLAQTFVAMCLMCVAVLFIHPTAPIQELIPPLLYLTIVPSTYVLAMTSGGKVKAA